MIKHLHPDGRVNWGVVGWVTNIMISTKSLADILADNNTEVKKLKAQLAIAIKALKEIENSDDSVRHYAFEKLEEIKAIGDLK